MAKNKTTTYEISETKFEKLKENAALLDYQLNYFNIWYPTKKELNEKIDLKHLTENDVFFLLWLSNASDNILDEKQKKTREYINDILTNEEYIIIIDEEFEKMDKKSKKQAFDEIFKKYGY